MIMPFPIWGKIRGGKMMMTTFLWDALLHIFNQIITGSFHVLRETSLDWTLSLVEEGSPLLGVYQCFEVDFFSLSSSKIVALQRISSRSFENRPRDHRLHCISVFQVKSSQQTFIQHLLCSRYYNSSGDIKKGKKTTPN